MRTHIIKTEKEFVALLKSGATVMCSYTFTGEEDNTCDSSCIQALEEPSYNDEWVSSFRNSWLPSGYYYVEVE